MHFLLFFVLLFVGRSDLQIRGIALCLAIWLALIAIGAITGAWMALVGAGTAILDIGLVIFIFRGDIPLRPKA